MPKSIAIIKNMQDYKTMKKYLSDGINPIFYGEAEKLAENDSQKWSSYSSKESYFSTAFGTFKTVGNWGNLKLKNKTLKNYLNIMDLPFWDFIRSNLTSRLIELSWKTHDIEVLSDIIEKFHPDELIYVDDGTAISMVCRCISSYKGIASKKIARNRTKNKFRKKSWDIFYRIAFDKKRNMRRMKKRTGFTKDQKVFSNYPVYKRMKNPSFTNEEKILNKLGFKKNKKTILFATQPSEFSFDAASVFCSAVSKHPDIQVIFKLHPRDMRMKYYEKLCSGIKNKYVITRTGNLYEMLSISHAVATTFSTVALEALMFGKPIITITTGLQKGISPYHEFGFALDAHNQKEIIISLQMLDDPKILEKLAENAKKFIYQRAYKNDGKATERIMEVVENLLTQ